jgi:hypothetical protein
MEWIYFAIARASYEWRNKFSASVKHWKFPDYLSNCLLLKNYFKPVITTVEY